ncbi:MATE family efflux transporter [Facklamia miroungae]|uniref:Probable multidrug resistance protein NorM n=1 Tax=Facklamia miroungae TaxID=120956 RepID=A0A1G7T6E0_9LACT|nr:MATE family efflux transporter [Facklamia miroungae]SDG30791.1 putative efflux protein, MATE family [Facklamia miroungae]
MFKVILMISAPLMFNNLVRTFYTVADGLFLAQLSAEDFAASAFSWPLNFLFISLGMGIGVAATALLSNFLGSKQYNRVQTYVDNTLLLTLSIGIVLSVLGYLATPWMLTIMGGSGSFLEKAIVYFKISFIGLVFDFAFFTYQAILNAQGNTKTLTIISAISMMINIVLDPIFIYDQVPFVNISGLGWGIAGAAWATVISKIVLISMAIYVVNQQSRIQPQLRGIKFNWSTSQHIMKLAFPSFLGYGGSSLGFTVMNALITSYGTNTLAAFSMVNRISDIVMQPQMGVGMALTSIIGQNMGAKLYTRANQIFKRAIIFILLMSVISSLIIMLFQDPILSIFIKESADSDLWIQAKEYLAYTAFIIFFMGLFAAFNGFFQGCGQTKYSMLMSLGRLWFIRVPIVMYLRYFTDLGSSGIWISMLISNMLIVVWGFYIYRKKDWKSLVQMQMG